MILQKNGLCNFFSSCKDRCEPVDQKYHDADVDKKYRHYDSVADVSPGSGHKLVYEHGTLQGKDPDRGIIVDSHKDQGVPAEKAHDGKGFFAYEK